MTSADGTLWNVWLNWHSDIVHPLPLSISSRCSRLIELLIGGNSGFLLDGMCKGSTFSLSAATERQVTLLLFVVSGAVECRLVTDHHAVDEVTFGLLCVKKGFIKFSQKWCRWCLMGQQPQLCVDAGMLLFFLFFFKFKHIVQSKTSLNKTYPLGDRCRPPQYQPVRKLGAWFAVCMWKNWRANAWSMDLEWATSTS